MGQLDSTCTAPPLRQVFHQSEVMRLRQLHVPLDVPAQVECEKAKA
jgi:hypothetical protein